MTSEPKLRVTCPRCWQWSGTVGLDDKAVCPLCHYSWLPTSSFKNDWNFSKRLQPLADNIYTLVWGENTKIYRDLGALDKERGIDVHLELESGLTLDIQEKFRRAQYRHFMEFTLEYKNNPDTDELGEFYHLGANYYFYSYVSQDENSFTDWWIVDLNKFKEGYSCHLIKEDKILENKEHSRATALVFKWSKLVPYMKTSSKSLQRLIP